MRRLSIALVVFTAVLGGSACAADNVSQPKNQTESFQYLEKWVGDFPDPIPPNNAYGKPARPALWEDPKVKAKMIDTLGQKRYDDLVTGWHVDNPAVTKIERAGNNLVFNASKPHSDYSHETIIFISLQDGGVQACWRDNEKAVWLASGGVERDFEAKKCQGLIGIDYEKIFHEQNSLEAKTQLKTK